MFFLRFAFELYINHYYSLLKVKYKLIIMSKRTLIESFHGLRNRFLWTLPKATMSPIFTPHISTRQSSPGGGGSKIPSRAGNHHREVGDYLTPLPLGETFAFQSWLAADAPYYRVALCIKPNVLFCCLPSTFHVRGMGPWVQTRTKHSDYSVVKHTCSPTCS